MEILITALIVIAVVFILYKNFKNHLKDNVVVAVDVLLKEVVLVEKIIRSKKITNSKWNWLFFIINYIFSTTSIPIKNKAFLIT